MGRQFNCHPITAHGVCLLRLPRAPGERRRPACCSSSSGQGVNIAEPGMCPNSCSTTVNRSIRSTARGSTARNCLAIGVRQTPHPSPAWDRRTSRNPPHCCRCRLVLAPFGLSEIGARQIGDDHLDLLQLRQGGGVQAGAAQRAIASWTIGWRSAWVSVGNSRKPPRSRRPPSTPGRDRSNRRQGASSRPRHAIVKRHVGNARVIRVPQKNMDVSGLYRPMVSCPSPFQSPAMGIQPAPPTP